MEGAGVQYLIVIEMVVRMEKECKNTNEEENMKKNVKKVISFILSMLVIISTAVTPAMAAGTKEAPTEVKTLYIPNGCNLTLTNMEILSSVRIVVENGGKLTLSDSVVQGIIDVQSGGTFSMNYDAYKNAFTTGSSICGQLRLADGAILENAAIYSHANYLANGDLTDRNTSEPVVTATGNVTIKGQVFIKGAEDGDGIGQTALRVDGTLRLADGAILVTTGGEGMINENDGGTAIDIKSGKITGNGKLVAIGGKTFWGNGGNAVTGNGTIETASAFLQGATASKAKNKEAGK